MEPVRPLVDAYLLEARRNRVPMRSSWCKSLLGSVARYSRYVSTERTPPRSSTLANIRCAGVVANQLAAIGRQSLKQLGLWLNSPKNKEVIDWRNSHGSLPTNRTGSTPNPMTRTFDRVCRKSRSQRLRLRSAFRCRTHPTFARVDGIRTRDIGQDRKSV